MDVRKGRCPGEGAFATQFWPRTQIRTRASGGLGQAAAPQRVRVRTLGPGVHLQGRVPAPVGPSGSRDSSSFLLTSLFVKEELRGGVLRIRGKARGHRRCRHCHLSLCL